MTFRKMTSAALAGLVSMWILQMTGCVSPKEVAQNSLVDLYKPTVSSDRTDDEAFAKDIGFNSLEELADAQLGSPLPLYSIRLLELKEFQPGDNPNKLLTDTNRIFFPLIVNGKFRSSLIVRNDSIYSLLKNRSFKGIGLRLMNLDWKGIRLTEVGFRNLMSKVEKQKPSRSSFLVSIAPLGLFLLGDRNEEGLVLTTIEANRKFGLNEGERHEAAELFSRISPHANRTYESNKKMREHIAEMDTLNNP